MEEFEMEISEAKSSVVRFNREPRQEKWKCGGWQVCESGAAKYLGMSVPGGIGGGFVGVSGRIKILTRVLGMVNFGAKRSGCPFLVAREGWKSVVVSKAMYGAWRHCMEKSGSQESRGDAESIWNAVVQGKSGWSTFDEREVKAKMASVRKILWGGSMVAEVERGALLEIGLQSGLWKEVERMALRFQGDELAHLIWRRRVSETGREMCGVGVDWIRDMTKEKMNERVMEVGKEEWKRLLQSTELTRKYAVEKEAVKLESCADGSVGARAHIPCGKRHEHLGEEWRERGRVENGDPDMMEGFWHKRHTNGGIVLLQKDSNITI
ncbi:hypothetical protein CAPTEDRAFT_210135 [Capitella teleta]|uniref:Uncharacterized protein n=1 Tax=Capitella teleta TaxID=283909 RepID=R7TV07_CAPTE|nr:hypothetical protein CAPTEDRAFT_210135 [Capitella teleta]|eukprot:ELT97743.1 hypothetical protein CAPTEDRAFT_210135 [Capitella teleta]